MLTVLKKELGGRELLLTVLEVPSAGITPLGDLDAHRLISGQIGCVLKAMLALFLLKNA